MKNLKDLAVDHPYYCASRNHHSNEGFRDFEIWEDFYEEWKDYDLDLNHVFRFDISKYEEGANKGKYYMQVFFMLQRKGLFLPVEIKLVEDKDVPSIINFLKPHFENIKEMWKPFSS